MFCFLKLVIGYLSKEYFSQIHTEQIKSLPLQLPFIRPCTLLWCRHQMQTISALLALCAGSSSATGEKASDAELWRFFDLCLNKRLS